MDYHFRKSKIKDRIVIKLSGSIFGQDTSESVIREYADMLSSIKSEIQPVVISGGGKIARHYIGLARALGSDEANLDIMGIDVSRLNARLLLDCAARQGLSKDTKRSRRSCLGRGKWENSNNRRPAPRAEQLMPHQH